MVWRAIAHSATGTRHQQLQQPCQDYSLCRTYASGVVGAIADGAGSARYAEIGAQLAVETAVSFLTTPDLTTQQLPWETLNHEPELTTEMVRALFAEVVQQVVVDLKHRAAVVGCDLTDLACTLLAFVATPEWAIALQIGDGFIVVGVPETQTYRLLFQPQKGEFINQTAFVTAADVLEQMQIGWLPGLQPFICAATDGLEQVAIRWRDWQPHPPFFQPLAECLAVWRDSDQASDYLQAFLNSNRLNARTDDDKTLLLCLYEHPA